MNSSNKNNRIKKISSMIFFAVFVLGSLLYSSGVVVPQQRMETNTSITLSQGAEKEMERENYIEAIVLFKKAIELNLNYVPARVGLSKAYYFLENYDRAKVEIEQARQIDGNSIIVLVWSAKIDIKLQNYVEAKTDLDNACDMDARNFIMLMTYGEYYRNLGRFTESIRYYNLAAGTDEDSIKPLVEKGNTYMMINRTEEAYQSYREAFERNPRDAEANYNLAIFYYIQNDVQKALKYVTNSVIISPHTARYLELNYQLLIKRNKMDESERILKQLVNFNNPKPKYYHDLGVVLGKQGKTEESVKYLAQGVQRYKGDEILRFRSEIEAIKGLKISNEKRKSLAEYRYKMGKFYKDRNIVDKSLFMLDRAIKTDPENLKYRYHKAEIYKDLGYDRRYYDIISLIDKENPNIYKESVLFRNLHNDLNYYERRLENSLSGKLGIDQYHQGEPFTDPLPNIVVSGIEIDKVSDSYFEANYAFQDILYRALSINDNFTTKFLDTRKVRNETDELYNLNTDFVVKARMKENGDLLKLSIDLQNVHNGVVMYHYESSQRGNNRFLNIALDFSENLSKNLPAFGRIRDKKENEVILNIGSVQGIKKNDIVYVLGSESDFRVYIRDRKNFETLKSIRRYSRAEIRIDEVDERISRGRVVSGDFQNMINENNFVVFPSHLSE